MALAGTGALAACGGGGIDPEVPLHDGSKRPLGVDAGGTGQRLSLISAPVELAFGALNVGGVSLNTNGAVLSDGDGQHVAEREIVEGMTARVLAGPITSPAGHSVAQALSLVVDTQLRGSARQLDAHTLMLLEQRVTLSARTVYGVGVDPAALNADLRVWGQLDWVGGRIVASRIDSAKPGESPMLRGLLAAVDPAMGLLQVGALTARAADPALVPFGLGAGAVVRMVLGDRGPDGVWELLALRDDALRPPDGVEAKLGGRVTQFSNRNSFAVDGVAVNATSASVEGGAYLLPGAFVEVSGSMRNGLLQARSVHAEAPEPIEFEGRIAAYDSGRRLLTVSGMELHWSSGTVFSHGTSRELRVGRQVAGIAAWSPGLVELEVTKLQFAN